MISVSEEYLRCNSGPLHSYGWYIINTLDNTIYTTTGCTDIYSAIPLHIHGWNVYMTMYKHTLIPIKAQFHSTTVCTDFNRTISCIIPTRDSNTRPQEQQVSALTTRPWNDVSLRMFSSIYVIEIYYSYIVIYNIQNRINKTQTFHWSSQPIIV